MSKHADLKRAYKEAEPEAGIYQIRNTVSGKVLVGSSANLHGPLNRHRFMLKFGSHQNQALQRDYNQFGEEAFVFEVVEVLKRRDDPDFSVELELSALEQRWVDRVQPFGELGYNLGPKIRDI
jgi:group I intron endonuclease